MAASRTASMCAPEKAQGTHTFDVFGYSLHRGMGIGRRVSSGVFSVGGHDWTIHFYPDGYSERCKDCISVHLELLSKGAVRASCDLRPAAEHRVFNQNDSSWMAPQEGDFKRRSELEASPYLRDDHLRIECVITVLKEPRLSETKSAPRIELPPSDITEHLGKLLESEKGADVTLSVEGETFTAHKAILAIRSPVFKAEIYGPMSETGMQLICIKDMQPAGNEHGEMIRHLLVAADRYAVDRLKLICQSILCEGLNVQNVATTLALADQHHCDLLKDACIEFISSATMDDIVATQGVTDLKRDCPAVLVDAFIKMSVSC
ncbi:hypothetical protein PVAP13_6NG104800 [Panicum virgatum]|uniref:Uncharacterized protein n=1 Tax=Panicum virgatum TaxID=38727 RepID=A0A8T0QWL1_PANVG|nr:hypothetical protein PVAP13_6NG104800 [Panicum virgatum]